MSLVGQGTSQLDLYISSISSTYPPDRLTMMTQLNPTAGRHCRSRELSLWHSSRQLQQQWLSRGSGPGGPRQVSETVSESAQHAGTDGIMLSA